MTRKCHECGETKNLKSGWYEEFDGIKNTSFCCKCFFDNEFENETEVTRKNWDDYNYQWELKKTLSDGGIPN